MDNIATLLKLHPVTHDLDDWILDLIAGCAHNMVFQVDERIFRHGDTATHFYLLRHGTVALEMSVPGKGLVSFQNLDHGEMLGASWLAPPYRWLYDARAIVQTRAIAFDASCLREMCEADHHMGYELMKVFIPIVLERMQAARRRRVDVLGKQSTGQQRQWVGTANT